MALLQLNLSPTSKKKIKKKKKKRKKKKKKKKKRNKKNLLLATENMQKLKTKKNFINTIFKKQVVLSCNFYVSREYRYIYRYKNIQCLFLFFYQLKNQLRYIFKKMLRDSQNMYGIFTEFRDRHHKRFILTESSGK